jgi:uncharacterized protein (TIGR02996 family)
VDLEPGFLAAIQANLDDDTPRLVFADWLDEHGQSERAEFIRLQCELEPIREDFSNERADALRAREEELIQHFWPRWRAERERLFGQWAYSIGFTMRRGFLDTLALPVQWFLSSGETIRQEVPTLRRLDLFRVAGWGERLADCPHLAGLHELEIACWITGPDAEALLASPHLSNLRMLRLWLGAYQHDEEVCQAIDRCAELPDLQEVQVVWGDLHRFAGRQGLRPDARRGNQVPAVRGINPNSRLYALAPGGSGYFDEFFPGRLPDGTQVFGQMPDVGSKILPLLFFDSDGNQIEERELVLPPHLVPQHGKYGYGADVWYQIVRGIAEHLRITLGHRPARICVEELEFSNPDGPFLENLPGTLEDRMGALDDPDTPPEADPEGPNGYGGSIYNWIATRNFVFYYGNDWWVNGITGHVEST